MRCNWHFSMRESATRTCILKVLLRASCGLGLWAQVGTGHTGTAHVHHSSKKSQWWFQQNPEEGGFRYEDRIEPAKATVKLRLCKHHNTTTPLVCQRANPPNPGHSVATSHTCTLASPPIPKATSKPQRQRQHNTAKQRQRVHTAV
jgi:hypothetical protein